MMLSFVELTVFSDYIALALIFMVKHLLSVC